MATALDADEVAVHCFDSDAHGQIEQYGHLMSALGTSAHDAPLPHHDIPAIVSSFDAATSAR